MFSRLIAKLTDWLVAILIVCALLWFFITQPILPAPAADDLPAVNTTNLKNHIINLQKIATSQQLMKESLSTDKYISSYLSRIGKPNNQSFVGMSGRYNNVSLLLGPKTGKRIVIGVQYSPPKGDTDTYWNSSGVATLLEVARLLGESEEKLSAPVELVAYATAGMAAKGTLDMGSFHHAKALKNKNVAVQFMIALQSVGYYRNEASSQKYPFSFMSMLYPDTGNFINLSGRLEDSGEIRSVKRSFERIPELLVESVSAPEKFPLVGGSDDENYWVHGFSALQVSDLIKYRVPKNQVPGQELTLDYTKMSRVTQALYQTVLDNEGSSDDDASEGFFSKHLGRIAALFE